LVFACPHLELGEAVGVAVVVAERNAGDAAAVVADAEQAFTLASLRQFLAATGVLESKWLPECLVFVSSTPRGPTGKPLRIGFAESLNIPQLSHSGASKAGGAGIGLTLRATSTKVVEEDADTKGEERLGGVDVDARADASVVAAAPAAGAGAAPNTLQHEDLSQPHSQSQEAISSRLHD